MPKTARVRTSNGFAEHPVETLRVGDLVQVRPGDRIPVDGSIERGESGIDQSPITGESVPVTKGPGDEVFAGTINQEAALEVEVTRLARSDSWEIVALMRFGLGYRDTEASAITYNVGV